MAPPENAGSELSSMAATIDDLVRRVAALADASAGTEGDVVAVGRTGTRSVAQELYEAERALLEAGRRMGGLADALRNTPGRD
jgi:protein tyrosine phosphatase (PTP) superfamily phosphohydrolase (DUF442 family)